MSKPVKGVQIMGIANGYVVVTQETSQPNIPPKIEQTYFADAKEAGQFAAEFLEPSVLAIVTGEGKKRPS